MANSNPFSSTLVAFDFDYTLIDCNTDTFIQEISPEKGMRDDFSKWKHEGMGWTECMRLLFKRIHKDKFSPDQIVAHMQNIQIPEQRLRILKFLSDKPSTEIIIISDSNTVFIKSILEAHGIENYFSKLYTNPASFNGDSLLEIEEFHQNTTCPLSPSNMCKQRILSEHVASTGRDRSSLRVIYVGDGSGDFCAAKGLLAQDYVIARQGYSLAKKLDPLIKSGDIAAKVVVSDFYEDMEQFFRSVY